MSIINNPVLISISYLILLESLIHLKPTHKMNIPEIDRNRINDLNENLDDEISKEEILKCVKSLKNDKACADDFIINEYIKSTCNQLLDIYVKLFNIIFKCGLIPESWILGTIKPFYKNKGNKYDPKKYRLY